MMHVKWTLWVGMFLALVVGGRGGEAALAKEHGPISLAEEAKLRRAAAERPRRIIYNNDGGDARVPSSPQTAEELLAARTTPLIGSQVDTIIYDTTAGTFGMFAHRTEVGEIFLTREGRYRHNMTPDLIQAGTDPLQVMLEFAQAHDFEFFWTMRMNDTHDASNPLLLPRLKQEHPELLFGSPDRRPPHGAWSAMDYGHPQVRELAFGYIEEVAENYEVDGIHLDFFRHSQLFKRVGWGEAISQAELDAMTSLMRRIRERTRAIGAARGKPILLAVRVPDSVAYCRAIGIDLERWLEEGLIDLLVPGGYFRLNPWETTVALGHRHGVPVYPSLDESRVNGRDRDRNSLASYRARAMNIWQAGADGVYLFNMFSPTHPMLREIGSPATLAGTDKLYFISVRGDSGSANPGRFVRSSENYFGMSVLTPDSPGVLASDAPLELELAVGEDLEAAREAGRESRVTLRLIVPGVTDAAEVEARLNGHLLEDARMAPPQLDYAVDPAWLRRGSNHLTIAAQGGSSSALTFRASAPSSGNRLTITELDVDTPDSHSLRLRVVAKATGQATLGSVSIRTPNKGDVDPVPPGFAKAANGYVYPKSWSNPGFLDNGPQDEDAQEHIFVMTLPMAGGAPGLYAVQVIAQNRPAPGPYFRDDRIVIFGIDAQGRVYLPRPVQDVQLRVQYSP